MKNSEKLLAALEGNTQTFEEIFAEAGITPSMEDDNDYCVYLDVAANKFKVNPAISTDNGATLGDFLSDENNVFVEWACSCREELSDLSEFVAESAEEMESWESETGGF